MVHSLLFACARLLNHAESVVFSRLQSLIVLATLGSSLNKFLQAFDLLIQTERVIAPHWQVILVKLVDEWCVRALSVSLLKFVLRERFIVLDGVDAFFDFVVEIEASVACLRLILI
jgi:hypothetical protein